MSTIQKDIIESLIGDIYHNDERVKEIVRKVTGMECRCYDSCIDDGCDDDEPDNYVMKDCFSIDEEGITIRIYYGDVTAEIGYISWDGEFDEPTRDEIIQLSNEYKEILTERMFSASEKAEIESVRENMRIDSLTFYSYMGIMLRAHYGIEDVIPSDMQKLIEKIACNRCCACSQVVQSAKLQSVLVLEDTDEVCVDVDELPREYKPQEGFQLNERYGVENFYDYLTREHNFGTVIAGDDVEDEEEDKYEPLLSDDLFALLSGSMDIEDFRKVWGTDFSYSPSCATIFHGDTAISID